MRCHDVTESNIGIGVMTSLPQFIFFLANIILPLAEHFSSVSSTAGKLYLIFNFDKFPPVVVDVTVAVVVVVVTAAKFLVRSSSEMSAAGGPTVCR